MHICYDSQGAYPTPNLPAVNPIDDAALDAAVEQPRFDRQNASRQERLTAAEEFKSEQKIIFQKAMPGWLRSKLIGQPANTPIQNLCNLA